MTLIAIHADADRAVILTDTWAYTASAQEIGLTTKAHALTHLDAAYATQGDCRFGDLWAEQISSAGTSFDELVAQTPARLVGIWNQRITERDALNEREDADYDVSPVAVFLVGYSTARETFVAYSFDYASAFAPCEISGLHLMPSPLSCRPSDLELSRYEQIFADHPLEDAGPEVDARILEVWKAMPPAPTPATVEEWVALGQISRGDRAFLSPASRMKVLVGGDLHLTVLTRGRAVQDRVHAFDDEGELAAIVAGTLHPFAQDGPCDCGSGTRYLDCHLASSLDCECLCGSQRPLRYCCALQAA